MANSLTTEINCTSSNGCSLFLYFQPLSPHSPCVTSTHTLQSLCCGWTWAAFPDVIKCGFSRATLPHFALLQLLLRPGPVIATYPSLRTTSAPTRKRFMDQHTGPVCSAPVNQVHWETSLVPNEAPLSQDALQELRMLARLHELAVQTNRCLFASIEFLWIYELNERVLGRHFEKKLSLL